jgi:sec-independent protein translocase protein TatC
MTESRGPADRGSDAAPQPTANVEMPFLDHLEELRWRLVWSLLALCVGFAVAFALLSKLDFLVLLQKPIRPYLEGRSLVITRPGEALGIVLNAALMFGVVFASPVIGYQLWAFLSPALYQHEKRVIIPVLMAAVALFLAGVALAFFVVLPLSLNFLLTFQTGALEPMITASGYFGFALGMAFAFGITFELPLLILALTALGVVTPQFLVTYRRHAIVLCAVASAFITPGADPTSMFALAVPLYLLYEVSVVLSAVLYRRRLRRERAAALAAAAPGETPALPLDQGGLA